MINIPLLGKNDIKPIYNKYKDRVVEKESFGFLIARRIFDGLSILSIGFTIALITKSRLITVDFVLQSGLMVFLLLCISNHSTRKFNITPFTTIPISSMTIAEFFLRKELYSRWIFMTYPFILPLILINEGLEIGSIQFLYFIVMIYFVGVAIILFSIIISSLIEGAKTVSTLTLGIIVLIYIFLSLNYEFLIVPLLDIFIAHSLMSVIGILAVILLLMNLSLKSIENTTKRLFEDYDSAKLNYSQRPYLAIFWNNSSLSLHFKEMVRCKGFQIQMRIVLFALFSGIVLYFLPGFKLFGFGVFVGAFSLRMNLFIILKDSVYFDSIYTKPVELRHLLISDYIISIILTSLSFLFSLIWVVANDPGELTALVTIFLFIIGPMHIIIFQAAVDSNKRFDPFAKFSIDDRSMMTDYQKIIGIMAGISIFIPVLFITLLPNLMSIFLIGFSILCIIIHPIWIQNVCNRFERRKYQAMERFRIQW